MILTKGISPRRFALLALAAVPVACSSPNPSLYVLAPVPGATQADLPGATHSGLPGATRTSLPGATRTGLPGATRTGLPGATRTGAPRIVVLHAIAIAHYLERSQIVRSSEGYRIDVLSNEWWGEPLDTMMSRILVQELNQRLPGTTVYGDGGAISTTPGAAVEINLQRFDLDRDGAVLLAAQIAIDGKVTATRGVSFQIRPADGTTQALVAAMSTATAQLADAVATMLAGR